MILFLSCFLFFFSFSRLLNICHRHVLVLTMISEMCVPRDSSCLRFFFLIKNWRWFSASEKARWEELAAFAVCGIWFALSEFLCPFICTFVRQFWYPPARTTTITSTGIPCHRLSFLKPANPSDKPFSIFSVSLYDVFSLLLSLSLFLFIFLSFFASLQHRNAFVFADCLVVF